MRTRTSPRVNAAPMNSVGSVPQVSGFRPGGDGDRDQAAEGDVGAGQERADQHAVPAAVGLLRPGLGGDLRHLLRFPRGHERLPVGRCRKYGWRGDGRLLGGIGGRIGHALGLVGQRAGLRGLRRQVEPARRARVPRLARRPARRPLAGRRLRHRRPHRGGARLLRTGAGGRHRAVRRPSASTPRSTVPDPRASFRAGDARALPVDDAAFDAVVSRRWCSTSCPTGRPRWPRCAARRAPGGDRRRLRLGLRRRHADADARSGTPRSPSTRPPSAARGAPGSPSAGPTRCARCSPRPGWGTSTVEGIDVPADFARLRRLLVAVPRRHRAGAGLRRGARHRTARRPAGRRPRPAADRGDGSIQLTARAWAVRGTV